MSVTYLFNLEYNSIKYELAMVSLNITVEWGAIHSRHVQSNKENMKAPVYSLVTCCT